MPIPIAVPLIASGAMSLFGAKKSSDAVKKASQVQTQAADRSADLQYKATQDALGQQREQWQTAQTQLRPYVDLGHAAVGRLSGMTGLSGARPSGNYGQMAQPSGQGGYSPAAMVQMQAPDGSVRPVPRTMVPHYLSRGGRVIG